MCSDSEETTARVQLSPDPARDTHECQTPALPPQEPWVCHEWHHSWGLAQHQESPGKAKVPSPTFVCELQLSEAKSQEARGGESPQEVPEAAVPVSGSGADPGGLQRALALFLLLAKTTWTAAALHLTFLTTEWGLVVAIIKDIFCTAAY